MKQLLNKITIALIIIGLLASIPLIFERINWEQSSKQVELVMDYDDLYLLTNSTEDPELAEERFFSEVKDYVNSIAIYEATLERLRIRGEATGDIRVYSGKDLLDPTRNVPQDKMIDPNHTYVLFNTQELKDRWEPQFRTFLSQEGEITDFEMYGMTGFEISAPYRFIKRLPLGLDPVLAEKINNNGFEIVPRLSNAYTDKERSLALIEQAAQYEISYIIFQGSEVTGYPNHLKDVASLLNKYEIGIGPIEMTKEQAGLKSLSYYLVSYNEVDERNDNWYIARVHSLTEYTMNKMVNPTSQQLQGVEPVKFTDLQEQVELAITERNIRIVYIHAPMSFDKHASIVEYDTINFKYDPEDIIDKTILAINDIGNRIEQEGYTLGKAEPFKYHEKSWMEIARWLTLIGGIAVISLLVARFIPSLQGITLLLGFVGILIAKLLNLESLYFKFIGLGTAVAIPVVAIDYSLRELKGSLNKKVSIIHLLKVYFVTALISFTLSALVVGMFNHVKYSLYIDQFRGVSVLYLAPLFLTLFLIMWSFKEPFTKWLKANFKNYYVIILGILGIIVLYYLSRSGNEATISQLEVKFRKLLQTNLDIRPRTKEFLFAYPLFVLAIYLSYYYKRAVYLLVAASMGQLSIVSTFTHLHTPYTVSVIRTGIGLVLGLIIGLILIVVWRILEPWLIKLLRRFSL